MRKKDKHINLYLINTPTYYGMRKRIQVVKNNNCINLTLLCRVSCNIAAFYRFQ